MAVIAVRHPVRLIFDPAPPLGIQPHLRSRPRPYQEEALAAWEAAERRGVVVLPTGAGKTLLGALAIARALTRTLVLVPTIVLCAQWRDELLRLLDLRPGAVGIVGGGRREWTCPMVAATYEGAARALGRVPAFGLLVADEVHHLPADTYRAIAQAAVAPFRLGLSATLARSDGRERDLNDLLGGVVYTERPDALAAEGYLAPFDEGCLRVDLGAEHRAAYDRDMGIFRAYRARRARARESALAFLERVRKRSSFDAAARAALLAYQRARTLALTSQAKIDALEELLARHADERCLIFAEHIDAVDVAGIGRAIREAGLQRKTCMMGTSIPSITGTYLADSSVDKIFLWDPALAGETQDKLALMLIKGQKVGPGRNPGLPGYTSLKRIPGSPRGLTGSG
jgi:superfamily II DNA or RNA helicase